MSEERVIQLRCPACGDQMKYDAGAQRMLCGSCGATADVPAEKDLLVEKSFNDAINTADAPTGMGAADAVTYVCKGCGAVTSAPKDQPVIVCSFCASEKVSAEAYAQRVIQPAGVLPFTFSREQALAAFKEWIGSGWFQPSKLASIARLSGMEGVYVPFWTYDAHTDSWWTADAGHYYYVTVSYTDENGNRQTREEQRVRWVPAQGFYQHWFDDVLVIGSGGLTQNTIADIYPFPLADVVNYDPKYLLGWKAEVYKHDVQQAFTVAEGIMTTQLYYDCGRLVPGDTHRNLNVNTHKYNITFKHILLPVWIAAYKFNDKTYQVLLNGRTGKLSGSKPISVIKVVLAIMAVLAVIALLYFVFGGGKP